MHNLTRNYSDWFFVKKVGSSYESGDSSIYGCIRDMKISTGVEFNFGGFHAKFDDKDNQLRLSGGCFADTLLFENSDFSMVVADATTLQANTLIVKRAVFKNEGVLETFIALL